MRKLLFCLLLLAASVPSVAQGISNFGGTIQYQVVSPSGNPCTNSAPVVEVMGAGTIWTCQGGTYGQVSGSGGGFTNPMTGTGDIIIGGSGGAATRLASPTVNGNYYLSWPVTGNAATAPIAALPGVAPRASTCTSNVDTITNADRAGYISWTDSSACAVGIASAATLGSNFVTVGCNIGAGAVTITPTTSTISSSNGDSYTSAASSLVLKTGWCATIYSDNTSYFAILRSNPTRSCTEVWGGTGAANALQSGDDAVANNSCYNDSGSTRTITAVKCRSDNGSNTTTVNPTFGSAGTGTTILSGAVTCGNSYAYSSSGTVSNASWTTGTGIDPAMSGTLTGTSVAMIVEYHY